MADGFGEHHNEPENDPQLLRLELDGCRDHIAHQRNYIAELELERDEHRDARERLVDALRRIRHSTAGTKFLRAEAAAALRREGIR